MLAGTVIYGDGVGKSTGYPTANIALPKGRPEFESGVYAGYANLSAIEYKAVIVVQNKIGKGEIHLLDYKGGDFYGKLIEARIVKKISNIKKIVGSTLQNKIEKDVVMVRSFLE